MVQNARAERDDTRRLIGGDRDAARKRRKIVWEEETTKKGEGINRWKPVKVEKTRSMVAIRQDKRNESERTIGG